MPRTSAAQKASANGQEPAWSIPSLREPRYSQSLERGLAILGCFTPKRPVLGIADIADELGMSRSTTHRYVITLVALGYLEQGASRKYRLGLRVTDLGMSALNSTGLREHAHPYLEELRQRTSYTTNLGVLDGVEILYVDRVRSFRRGQSQIDLDLHTGSRLPAYCTAMGKLLLANLPESEQRELIGEIKLTKRGPNTITSKKALREELEDVAAAGFAVDDEELGGRAVRGRGAGAQRGPRRGRGGQPGRPQLDDLPGGARRRARPAPRLHGGPHLRAPRLPARRRAKQIAFAAMRRPLALICACTSAFALAACAKTVSTAGFKGAEQEVATTIKNLQADATAAEPKKICADDVSAAIVTGLGGTKGCEAAIKSQLSEVDSLEVTVQSIKLAPGGRTATASVKSVNEGKSRASTVALVKEGGKWKVSSVG